MFPFNKIISRIIWLLAKSASGQLQSIKLFSCDFNSINVLLDRHPSWGFGSYGCSLRQHFPLDAFREAATQRGLSAAHAMLGAGARSNHQQHGHLRHVLPGGVSEAVVQLTDLHHDAPAANFWDSLDVFWCSAVVRRSNNFQRQSSRPPKTHGPTGLPLPTF